MKYSLQKNAISFLLDQVNEGKLIIDEDAKIYRITRGKLKHVESINHNGYYRIAGIANNRSLPVLSHRFLYALYHGIDSLDDKKTIHHIDHNKLNNKKDNLAQLTRSKNASEGAIYYKNSKPVILPNGAIVQFRINELLKESSYNRDYIAKHLEISIHTLSRWSQGKAFPPLDKALMIADLFDCKLDDLYRRV